MPGVGRLRTPPGNGIPLMLLHSLIRQLDPQPGISAVPNLEVTGVCEDSRLVSRGNLFIARPGTKADGQQYLADALARGAAAAVVKKRISSCALPQVVFADPASSASILAHAFHQHPGRTVRTLGVTGTN